MRTAIQAMKAISVLLLWFGGGYTLFFYVAHFGAIQSLILAGVALCAADGYRVATKAAERTQAAFEPFWIRIEPNWYNLCQDFKLYDVANWGELQQKCGAASPADYSVVRNGFSFTMLSPTLYYSNDHRSFFRDLDFRMPAEEFRPEGGDQMSGSFAPRFYVKRRLAGPTKSILVIDLGLVTAESLKRSRYPTDDADEMSVASLPEIVFFGYMHPDLYNYDMMRKIEEQSNALLADFGWERKKRDPEDRWMHCPIEITHKYVKVTYLGI